MKPLTPFIDNIAEILGWTLVHSTWQALIILILVVVALRLINLKRSSLRYAIACGGLLTMIVSSTATFLYLSSNQVGAHKAQTNTFVQAPIATGIEDKPASAVSAITTSIGEKVNPHMPLIVSLWLTGTLLFSLRILSGWWYILLLRSRAQIVDNEWHELLMKLASDLNISKVVKVATSSDVSSPMVLGYLKPVILIPVGMFSGLTTAQLETIFLHELAHIRRHDYIVNMAQCIIESLFFFNPFVWMLSRIIRSEREYCCDDTVVRKHGSATVYAHALARLEEARLAGPRMALPLAENKNLLLNRIKRIMEKSVKNYSGRDKLIPIVLLVIGITCASWITITSDGALLQPDPKNDKVAVDTVDKKKNRSATYSKRTIITYDDNGEPHEEITESLEGDEELGDIMPDMTFDFHMPQMPVAPDFPAMPSHPSFPSFPQPPMPMNFHFGMDTIPGAAFGFSQRDWEMFSEEFEQKFQDQFDEFYKSHGKDLEKMMEDFGRKFGDDFAAAWDAESFNKEMKQFQEEMQTLSRNLSSEHSMEAVRELEHFQREWEHEHREHFEKLSKEMEENSLHLQKMQIELENNMESFQHELKEEVVKDGYIEKGEDIKSINWDDDGEIEINGIQIKKADREKYNRIHGKYFKGDGHFRYVE